MVRTHTFPLTTSRLTLASLRALLSKWGFVFLAVLRVATSIKKLTVRFRTEDAVVERDAETLATPFAVLRLIPEKQLDVTWSLEVILFPRALMMLSMLIYASMGRAPPCCWMCLRAL